MDSCRLQRHIQDLATAPNTPICTHMHTQAHTLLLMKEASQEVKGLILPVLHKRGKVTDLFNGIWVVQGCYGHLK